MKQGIFVGIPSLSGRVRRELVGWLAALVELRHQPDCPWWFEWKIQEGCAPVDYARNRLVADFLASDCDRLWMVDDDMKPPEDWSAMLNVPSDIVGGRFMGFWEGGEGVHAFRMLAIRRDGDHFKSVLPQDPDPEVDAVGTGSILINRYVLEDPRMRYPEEYADLSGNIRKLSDHVDKGNVGVPVFRTVFAPDMQRIGTEDYAFCLRARDCGYRVTLADTWWDQNKNISLHEVNRTLLHHINLAQREVETV